MKRFIKISVVAFILFASHINLCNAQHYFKGKVSGLSVSKIYLQKLDFGDKFIVDSVTSDSNGVFKFLFLENYQPGLYRLIFDINRTFDFVYNNENIEIESHIEHLFDSILVVKSKENLLYYTYLKNIDRLVLKTDLLFSFIDYYPVEEAFYNSVVKEYNKTTDSINYFIEQVNDGFEKVLAFHFLKLQFPVPIPLTGNSSLRVDYLKLQFPVPIPLSKNPCCYILKDTR